MYIYCVLQYTFSPDVAKNAKIYNVAVFLIMIQRTWIWEILMTMLMSFKIGIKPRCTTVLDYFIVPNLFQANQVIPVSIIVDTTEIAYVSYPILRGLMWGSKDCVILIGLEVNTMAPEYPTGLDFDIRFSKKGNETTCPRIMNPT